MKEPRIVSTTSRLLAFVLLLAVSTGLVTGCKKRPAGEWLPAPAVALTDFSNPGKNLDGEPLRSLDRATLDRLLAEAKRPTILVGAGTPLWNDKIALIVPAFASGRKSLYSPVRFNLPYGYGLALGDHSLREDICQLTVDRLVLRDGTDVSLQEGDQKQTKFIRPSLGGGISLCTSEVIIGKDTPLDQLQRLDVTLTLRFPCDVKAFRYPLAEAPADVQLESGQVHIEADGENGYLCSYDPCPERLICIRGVAADGTYPGWQGTSTKKTSFGQKLKEPPAAIVLFEAGSFVEKTYKFSCNFRFRKAEFSELVKGAPHTGDLPAEIVEVIPPDKPKGKTQVKMTVKDILQNGVPLAIAYTAANKPLKSNSPGAGWDGHQATITYAIPGKPASLTLYYVDGVPVK